MAGSDFRVSDLERDEAARVLRDHCAVGRLSFEDLDRRLEGVYRAETKRELELLMLDLPAPAEPSGPERRGRRIFWPGVAAFREERHLRSACGSSYSTALREIVPRMGLYRFHLAEEIEPRMLRFVSDGGLFVTVMFHRAHDGGTDVSAFGHAPRRVRKAFATLRD